jgi:hypothetical protein
MRVCVRFAEVSVGFDVHRVLRDKGNDRVTDARGEA